MGQHVLPGNPPISLNLRRSARARRITLRVSSLDGRVTLTLPTRVAEREALEFANAAAALSTLEPGAQSAMPSRERVLEMLAGS